MTLRNRQQKFNPLLVTGMVILALAGLARLFFHRLTHLPEALTDGVMGLLYGVAIGCMIWGMARNRRRAFGTGTHSGA
jgi:hypothetical protein